MNVSPLKSYAEPTFPTRRIIDEHPELLRLVPKRWQSNPAVLAALTALVAIASTGRAVAAERLPANASRIAPIFHHGEGRGAFGCKAVNPPVLLSEDEARQVVVDEGKRTGVFFEPDVVTLPLVSVPITARWGFRADFDKNDNYHPRKRTQRLPVKLDGTDRKRHISYEIVSESDFKSWETRDLSKLIGMSAWDCDIVGAAEDFRDGMRKAQPQGVIGIFYDPCVGRRDVERRYHQYLPKYGTPNVDWKAEGAKMDAKAKELAREELSKQVKDFITWLKAQGVI